MNMHRAPDIQALENAIAALEQSSCPRMLEANLRFLWDYFVDHPSKALPKHLKAV